MNLLRPNFWLLCLGILLVNVALGYRRAAKLVTAGRLIEDERQRFTRGAVFFLGSIWCSFSGILWAIGVVFNNLLERIGKQLGRLE